MKVIEAIEQQGHEQIVFCHDKKTGLKAIIAIHNTQLGPALGGTRLWPYQSEDEALFDVLRLSRGMTYKNSAAGLNFGGGKAVIIAAPDEKSPELFKAYGKFVDSLGGKYVTAADVNTQEADMINIRTATAHVAGLPKDDGGSGSPSPFTALGTFEGIKSSVLYKLKKSSLDGITVAVQGLGSVGETLCQLLKQAGASLIVTDVNAEHTKAIAKQYDATVVEPEDIYAVDADVFAPCALGAIINDETIPQLKCSIIAGAANNQLLEDLYHGETLREMGILYAPDYIINAGGVINISYEIQQQYDEQAATQKVKNIGDTLAKVYQLADEKNITTPEAAALVSESRLAL